MCCKYIATLGMHICTYTMNGTKESYGRRIGGRWSQQLTLACGVEGGRVITIEGSVCTCVAAANQLKTDRQMNHCSLVARANKSIHG